MKARQSMSLNGYGNRGDGMEQTKKVVSVYRELLQEYLRSKDEKVLYKQNNLVDNRYRMA